MAKGTRYVEFDTLSAPLRAWLLALASTDMTQAEIAAEEAVAHALDVAGAKPDNRFVALSDVAVVRYCRPFTTGELPGGKGRTRLPARFKPAISGGDAAHELALRTRDRALAHNDTALRSCLLDCMQIGSEVAWRAAGKLATYGILELQQLMKCADAVKDAIFSELSVAASTAFPDCRPGSSLELLADASAPEGWRIHVRRLPSP